MLFHYYSIIINLESNSCTLLSTNIHTYTIAGGSAEMDTSRMEMDTSQMDTWHRQIMHFIRWVAQLSQLLKRRLEPIPGDHIYTWRAFCTYSHHGKVPHIHTQYNYRFMQLLQILGGACLYLVK